MHADTPVQVNWVEEILMNNVMQSRRSSTIWWQVLSKQAHILQE